MFRGIQLVRERRNPREFGPFIIVSSTREEERVRVLHIYHVHGRLLKLPNTPPRGKWSVLNLNKNTGSRVHKPSL